MNYVFFFALSSLKIIKVMCGVGNKGYHPSNHISSLNCMLKMIYHRVIREK